MIEGIDHLVLTVADIEKTRRFYVDLLGMRAETFGDGRTALHFGTSKINLHLAGREIEPHALRPTPGSADLCFVVGDGFEKLLVDIPASGVDIEQGPVERTGARGKITSIYLRDPDQNLIELSTYARDVDLPHSSQNGGGREQNGHASHGGDEDHLA